MTVQQTKKSYSVKKNISERADKLIKKYAFSSGLFGYIPFPVLDAFGIMTVQRKMLFHLAKVYSIPYSRSLAKDLLRMMAGGIASRAAIPVAIKMVPGINILFGSAGMAAIGSASTYAVGKVFKKHFEEGGSLEDFNPDKEKETFEAELKKGVTLSSGNVDANTIQRSILALIQWIFLPIFVFFTTSVLTFNASLFKYSMYAITATAVAMAIAWFWLARTKHEPSTKGALLVASCFGSVVFIGLPLNNIMIGAWSMRLSVVYLLLTNILILYTAGMFLFRAMAKPSTFKLRMTTITNEALMIIKEPVVIAALLGLLVNITGITLPAWIGDIITLAGGALIPLLILTVGLSLTWDSNWIKQWKDIAPVAAIKLILIPVVLLVMIKLFGSPGVKTSQALLINGMMPTSLLGLAVCDRFNLDSKTYLIAFVVTSILAVVTVPIWLLLV